MGIFDRSTKSEGITVTESSSSKGLSAPLSATYSFSKEAAVYTNQGESQHNIDDLERFGDENDVHRGLKSRHVQLIALGGCIGTGLFVGSGGALSSAGPAGLLTAYLIMAIVLYFVMNPLGEMTTYLPIRGVSCSGLVSRYADPSLGFACGWNYWYSFVILVATEVTAASSVINYWTDKVHIAVWIVIFLIVIVALNFSAVQYYGETEFWFASLKIFCILGLIIVGIVIFFGGAPASDGVLGFHYWKTPGAFAYHITTGNTGRFTDVWTGVIRSAFAFILGPELVVTAAGETESPRRNIPKATNRFVYRIIFFYVAGSLVIGVTVAYDNGRLMNAISSGASGAAASPFVIGIQLAGIKVLNHIVNAVILTSAWSSGNSYLFASSRSLLTLAKEGQAPKIFAKCNRWGVPYYSVGLSSLIACLAFLNVSSGTTSVFNWFSNICTVGGFLGWISLGILYIRFRKAIFYNNLWDRVPFKTPFQPYSTYFMVIVVSIITLTNGYAVFIHGNWSAADFVAAYITLPIFFVLYAGHKIWYRTPFLIPLDQIDVTTGLEEVEEEEKATPERIPKNWVEKVWFWLA